MNTTSEEPSSGATTNVDRCREALLEETRHVTGHRTASVEYSNERL